MPTKRRRITRPLAVRITPEAVEAFLAGDDARLARVLRRKPWQPSPFHATTEEPIPGSDAYRASWAEARALRIALEAAVKASESRS